MTPDSLKSSQAPSVGPQAPSVAPSRNGLMARIARSSSGIAALALAAMAAASAPGEASAKNGISGVRIEKCNDGTRPVCEDDGSEVHCTCPEDEDKKKPVRHVARPKPEVPTPVCRDGINAQTHSVKQPYGRPADAVPLTANAKITEGDTVFRAVDCYDVYKNGAEKNIDDVQRLRELVESQIEVDIDGVSVRITEVRFEAGQLLIYLNNFPKAGKYKVVIRSLTDSKSRNEFNVEVVADTTKKTAGKDVKKGEGKDGDKDEKKKGKKGGKKSKWGSDDSSEDDEKTTDDEGDDTETEDADDEPKGKKKKSKVAPKPVKKAPAPRDEDGSRPAKETAGDLESGDHFVVGFTGESDLDESAHGLGLHGGMFTKVSEKTAVGGDLGVAFIKDRSARFEEEDVPGGESTRFFPGAVVTRTLAGTQFKGGHVALKAGPIIEKGREFITKNGTKVGGDANIGVGVEGSAGFTISSLTEGFGARFALTVRAEHPAQARMGEPETITRVTGGFTIDLIIHTAGEQAKKALKEDPHAHDHNEE